MKTRNIICGILLILAVFAGGCQAQSPVSVSEEPASESPENRKEETTEAVTTEAETTMAEMTMVKTTEAVTTEAETTTVETTAAATTEAQKEEEALKTIGVEGSGESYYCVRLKNSTGKDITGVSVRNMGDEEFPENMLEETDVFKVREERLLYYDGSEAVPEATGDDKLLTPGFDILLTFADETTVVLHGFPFGDLEEGSICCVTKEWIGFVRYYSLSSGEKVSTRDAERFIRQGEEAAREEERRIQEEESRAAEEAAAEESRAAAQAEAERQAAAQAEAERQAAAQAEAERQAAAQAEAERQAAAQTQPPAPPAPPAQNAEQCLGDDALLY